jgi:hypothetical protein
MTMLQAQATSPQTTNSSTFADIIGLHLNLPGSSPAHPTALIILNVPMPYATGNNFPGVYFGIEQNGTLIASGGFTYNEQIPPATGRVPTTVVVVANLIPVPSTFKGVWSGIRNSTAHIDSYATLVAVF